MTANPMTPRSAHPIPGYETLLRRVESLRDEARTRDRAGRGSNSLNEAATLIESLATRVKELEEERTGALALEDKDVPRVAAVIAARDCALQALRPFAEATGCYLEDEDDGVTVDGTYDGLTLGNLRAARAIVTPVLSALPPIDEKPEAQA